MNAIQFPASHAIDSAEDLSDEEDLPAFSGPDLISDDDIDYDAIARNTQPGQPGGEIVFSTADYATDEEAMAALEALFLKDLEGLDDEAASEA